MTDGFLGRWSRRKQAVRDGEAVPPAPAVPVPVTPDVPMPAGAAPAPAVPAPADASGPEAPPLTLQDAQALTPASDFKPFMARGVTADVRNAAMKKLFADPQFNVMDRLDIYIDDYSQPDPLPAAMLRQMASARVLDLVPDEPAVSPTVPGAGDDADGAAPADVAPSGLPPERLAAAESNLIPAEPTGAPDPDHAHTDLRLQPDHAPERPGAGPGPA